MNISKTLFLSTLTLSLASILAAPEAQAVDALRTSVVNATGACQSALPVFDGNIRKRPKAVVNEGDSPAFVTCTYYGQPSGNDGLYNPLGVTIHFSTNVLQQTSVTCTGVNGTELDSFPTSVKTVNLNNPVNTVPITWLPGDFGSNNGRLPSPFFSVSCELKPDVAIHQAIISYFEPVGN